MFGLSDTRFGQAFNSAANWIGDRVEDGVRLPGEIISFGENLSKQITGLFLSGEDRAERIQKELTGQQVGATARQFGVQFFDFVTNNIALLAVAGLVVLFIFKR